MIELTEYAKKILRENPEVAHRIRECQAISRAVESCGLTIVTIQEMNVLLRRP